MHNLQKLNTNAIKNENNEYYTPKEVFTKLNIKNVVYDPATTKWNAERLNIPNYDDKLSNGLTTNWNKFNGNIWINPPFTLKKEFIKKASQTIKNGFKHKIYILVPDKSLTNKYMYNLLNDIKWSIIIPSGRINFLDEKGNQTKGSFFGSVVLILNTTKNEIMQKYLN